MANETGAKPMRSRLQDILLCVLPATLVSVGAGHAEGRLQLQGGRLSVRSAALELAIQGGAIVTIKDRKTGEVFSDGEPWPRLPAVLSGVSSRNDLYDFRTLWRWDPPRYARKPEIQSIRYRPKRSSIPDFRTAGDAQGTLVYRDLTNGKEGDELVLTVSVEAGTGDILLQATAKLADPQSPPRMLDVPLMGLKAPAVILGNGARYTASDPPVVDFCMRLANNLYSPRVAVIEGKQGCIGVWPDSPFMIDNLYLAHRAEENHVILHAGLDHRQKDPAVLRSVAWRIGTFSNWVEAARRYRAGFEKRTGARPLWEHNPGWVRKIHAVHTVIPETDKADAYYADLARRFDPSKLLLFYWNGNGIILFGDHRYMTVAVGRPKPKVIDAIKKHGFRWVGYHPYVLLFSPDAAPKRLEEIKTRGWGLPDDYTFTPDYDGPPDKFYNYFRPIGTNYYSGEKLWLYHPGSPAGRKYLVRNFGNYCKFHQMDGAYFDILGSEHASMFPKEKKVFDGLNYRTGEERALREIKEAHPELAVMSEVQGAWTVAHTFYSWAGAGFIGLPKSHPSIKTKTDHPLRTALWGSYLWGRESRLDPVYSALLGCLPELDLSDDWEVARCRLFTEEELFHDLPKAWDPDAYAYYRVKGGRWFQFRKLPFGDGYVELTQDGYQVKLARLVKQSRYPLEGPGRIQHWPAYKSDRPIGLNPAGTYPFLMERPKPDQPLRITDLPEGVFISAIRHSDTHSVIEFGTGERKATTGDIHVALHRRCLSICQVGKDTEGPFEVGRKLTLAAGVPGGLVFVWKEPDKTDTWLRHDLPWAMGHIQRNSIYRPAEPVRVEKANLRGNLCPTLRIVTGEHRGYAEQWVELPEDMEPTLKFEVLQERVGKESPMPKSPLVFSVHLNGAPIWRGELAPKTEWTRCSAPLERYAGRTVLLTFSAERICARRQQVGSFGYVRLDDPMSGEDTEDTDSKEGPSLEDGGL